MATVLVVDDAPFIREIVRGLLEPRGHTIIGEAIDGEMAIAMALKLRPDVILMDLVMPKVSGIEATKEIMAAWPAAYIIAVSTADHETLMSRALEVGCRKFLPKPFEREDLYKSIETD